MASLPKESRTIGENPGKSAISAYGGARSTIRGTPLDPDELRKIDAYWRASLYLCLGMLYLKEVAFPSSKQPGGACSPRILREDSGRLES
jgi:hypothetical protein